MKETMHRCGDCQRFQHIRDEIGVCVYWQDILFGQEIIILVDSETPLNNLKSNNIILYAVAKGGERLGVNCFRKTLFYRENVEGRAFGER